MIPEEKAERYDECLAWAQSRLRWIDAASTRVGKKVYREERQALAAVYKILTGEENKGGGA